MTCLFDRRKTCWILVVILVITLMYTVSAASGSNSVVVIVKDALTKENLDGTLVFLDGGYRGATSSAEGNGTFVISDVTPGTHTIRVTSPGFNEFSQKFVYPAETTLGILLSKGSLVSLNPDDSAANAINVIFYPSSTSYNCANHTNVSTPVYLQNETRFKNDVMNLIHHAFLNLDQDTSQSYPLPKNYEKYFNFYYYYDPSAPGDAFSGCAGTVPESYWNEVTFSDVTVILYPTYFGIYADSSCQPTGCFQNFGPGRNLMKAPADREMLVKHETGHAVFELVDTYCGTTYYYQNDPHPNVWASLVSCKADARSNNRDPEQCHQIQNQNSLSPSCIKNYWNWDPMPDIMASGYGGKFGDAATQRINYVLLQSGAD
jgi:hypothetical protein